MSDYIEQLDLVTDVRELTEDLGYCVATWSRRDNDPAKPQPQARAAAGDAVQVINGMLAKLRQLRGQLVGEIRQHDDAFNAALDAKLGLQ